MSNITGFEKLERELNEAQQALHGLEGELGTVQFDPRDTSSIDAAVVSVEALIDARLAAYSRNSIIGPMIAEMKDQYRGAIMASAAQAGLDESAGYGS
jgi:hypothetical protein